MHNSLRHQGWRGTRQKARFDFRHERSSFPPTPDRRYAPVASLTDATVDALAQQVGVPAVSRVLVDFVHE